MAKIGELLPHCDVIHEVSRLAPLVSRGRRDTSGPRIPTATQLDGFETGLNFPSPVSGNIRIRSLENLNRATRRIGLLPRADLARINTAGGDADELGMG